MLHSPAYFTSLLKASRKGITMCSMDGRVKALVIARECSRVRFLSVLALLVKEALLLGLRRWIDVFQEESMVNCRLCADSVLGVHVHQLRQQAEKGVSRFDGGDAFAHHEVDDASLAERGARFNIRHYVRPFHRTVFVKEKGANVFFHAHDHVPRKTVTSDCTYCVEFENIALLCYDENINYITQITTGTKEILNIFGRRHCCTTPFVILMMDLLRFVIGQFS